MRKPPTKGTTEPTPAQQAMDEMIAAMDAARLAEPGMTPRRLAAEKARHAEKFDRQIAKARAKWQRMSVLERKAWAEAHLAETRRYDPTAKMPTASDLPLTFAVVTIAEKVAAKAAKRPAPDYYALHRPRPTAEPSTPRATSPSPEPEASPVEPEPPAKQRRRRKRQPRSWIQNPDGSRTELIYDEDDE